MVPTQLILYFAYLFPWRTPNALLMSARAAAKTARRDRGSWGGRGRALFTARRGAHAAPAQPVDKAQLCLHPARGSPVEPTFDKRSPPLTARLQLTDRSSPTRWPCCSSCPPSRPRATSCSCPPSFPWMRLHLQPLLTAAAVALAPAAIAATSSSSNAIAPAALPTVPPFTCASGQLPCAGPIGPYCLRQVASSECPSEPPPPWSTASVLAAISKSPSAPSPRLRHL